MQNKYKTIDKLTKVSKQFLINAKIAELLGENVIYDIQGNSHCFHSLNPDSVMLNSSNQSLVFNPHIDQEFTFHHMHMIESFSSGKAYSPNEYYVDIGGYKSFGKSINIAFLKSYLPYLEDKEDSLPYSKQLLELINLNL